MFPDELKQYHQWVCWKYALSKDQKPTKLPYNPRTGQLASHSDPSSWTDFDTACNAYNAANGYFSGIGFVFTDNDPFGGIDLDSPYKDATPEQARRIISVSG